MSAEEYTPVQDGNAAAQPVDEAAGSTAKGQTGNGGAGVNAALTLARNLQGLYDGFTDAIQSMGSKAKGKKGKSKLAESALHWIAGSRVKTERDVLCERFLQDVQDQLQTMDDALEDLTEEEVQEVLGTAVDILSQPVPEESNATTALMKRAMLSQAKPYLNRLSQGQLRQLKERLEGAYKKSQRLPVEKEVLKEIDGLLG